MKHFKKLNAKGFVHWVIPALAIAIIGGIGSYILLRPSHADIITDATKVCGSGYTKVSAHSAGTLGLVELYANSNTRTLCAFTFSTGSVYGVSKPMSIYMDIQTNAIGQMLTQVSAKGNYKYFVGPKYIQVTDAMLNNNRYVYVDGTVKSQDSHFGFYIAKDFTFKTFAN